MKRHAKRVGHPGWWIARLRRWGERVVWLEVRVVDDARGIEDRPILATRLWRLELD